MKIKLHDLEIKRMADKLLEYDNYLETLDKKDQEKVIKWVVYFREILEELLYDRSDVLADVVKRAK